MTSSFAPLALPHSGRLYFKVRAWADRRLSNQAAQAGIHPSAGHLRTGERGEDLAYFLLRDLGFTIVARRWHSARMRGDLDLVAWDGDTLVAIEVKTRTARDFSPPEAAVDREKKRRLRRMARAYRGRLPQPWRDHVPIRFDVVSIYDLPSGAEWSHLRGAFPLTEAIP